MPLHRQHDNCQNANLTIHRTGAVNSCVAYRNNIRQGRMYYILSCAKTMFNYLDLYPAKDCGPLAVPTNGSSRGKLTTFPNKILFNCDEGFHRRGSHIRHCRENGTWSGNETFCQGNLMFLFWLYFKLQCVLLLYFSFTAG